MSLEWKSKPQPQLSWIADGEVTATLTWERKTLPFALEWIGPDQVATTAISESSNETLIAAVFGPAGEPGQPGKDGKDGPQGPVGPAGSTILPDVLDGGNF